ncbi:MAG TPA: urease accessory protein UreD [Kiloniellaceae bacterium]|nr:urease accessory protein UreD [Kiloniellaceae bacterium]
MSVATSLSEARSRRAGAEIVALRRPAVAGEAVLGVRAADGVTRLAELYQRDPLSLRLPQPEPGDILEASLITTSGGIVGGDRLTVTVTAGPDARLRVYPQAAEKVYRSLGPDSGIGVTLKAEAGAWLEWLPQETILFEGARLRRDTRVEAAVGARVLAGEFLVFGRRASGESLTQGLVHDAWRLIRDGRLAWADALHIEGDLAAPLASAACFDGTGAYASLVYAADDAPAQLGVLRGLLPPESDDLRHALTAVNGVVVGRFLGDALAVRRSYGAFWAAARHALAGLPPRLPRLWYL